MIARGEFREDLYYRLNGITIELPPLAQRTDKERLIREFLASESSDGRPAAIEVEAFQQLLHYSWPGNVRELRNVIRTALAICDGGVIRIEDLPSELRRCAVAPPAQLEPERASGSLQVPAPPINDERAQIEHCIRECMGNMSKVADQLGMSRNTLYRHCKRLGIPLRHPRPEPS
jgi:transcriptional regulator of acetoin/glycerol metabolism